MSAKIIKLSAPYDRQRERSETFPVFARLPLKVGARLRKISEQWNMSPNAAAELLLIDAINKTTGVKR